ncbi:MAG: hypothetical protein HC896_11655 [Bacteroidales bacterium]|nr:hypothetical protein [Bacteroidales bacterium]
MYGTTETACCLNLINPSLTNPFNLVKVGTPTFNANGITTTGTQYFRTGVIPSTHTTLNNVAIGVYIYNYTGVGRCAIGCQNTSTNVIAIYIRTTSACDARIYSSSSLATANIVNTSGLSIANKPFNNLLQYWNKGIKYGTNTAIQAQHPTREMYLGAINDGSANNYLNNNYSFAAVTLGKTDQQCIDITNAVNNLQTALGRAV